MRYTGTAVTEMFILRAGHPTPAARRLAVHQRELDAFLAAVGHLVVEKQAARKRTVKGHRNRQRA